MDSVISYANEKIVLMVDGVNNYSTAKALGLEIDYEQVIKMASGLGMVRRCIYFTSVATKDDGHQTVRKLLDFLEYHHWEVVERPAKEDYSDGQIRHRSVPVTVDISVAAMELAGAGIDHFMIFSGDGSLTPLVDSLQRQGKRVTVVSTIKTQPVSCSDELRRMADNFLDIADIADQIRRVPK